MPRKARTPEAFSRQERVRIYQLFPRLFGNINETRKQHGTLAENGVGKFADLHARALASLRVLGCTHLWLTGVLRHATSTDYRALGLPADDPDLLKGLAGSPFAIKDYFDVCPDFAIVPARRIEEFRALLARIRAARLRTIIDFVPNHVARSYRSTVRPDLDFGAQDDRTSFFDPRNNFFWLQRDSPGGGPPLRLPTFGPRGEVVSPTCRVLVGGDGLYDGELDCGRVTGNNVTSWAPAITDWYETAKLNFGYDFTTGTRAYPHAAQPDLPIPDTWSKMDAVLAYWQEAGIDGFRCDMAHMVPTEFWAWIIARARARQPDVLFLGEAYDNDPMKVGKGPVMEELLAAGFDAVYDDPSYKTLKGIYDGPRWANDLAVAEQSPIFHRALRYAENHDEVRLAGANQWGGIGMKVGRSVAGIFFGLSRGPVLLHCGQEVGEPAAGAEGFGGDDARTTIFDYWSMPEFAKWVNGHACDGGRLSKEQRDLRLFYGRLLRLVGEPAFCDGEFFPFNPANLDNPDFGRLPGETVSGHWLYAFLRHDAASGQGFLVVVNLHRSETLRAVRIVIPDAAAPLLGTGFTFAERLRCMPACDLRAGKDGLKITAIPPLTPLYFEILPPVS
jgi:glycosidase